MHFHEYNAAEIERGLRVDYDPVAGRPRKVTYRVDPDAVAATAETERGFARDVSTEGAQSSPGAYAKSGYELGHLAQREAFKGSGFAERSVDLMTNIVPMTLALNRGPGSPWRAAERRTVAYASGPNARQVIVEIEPVYAANPPRLSNGTPIPHAFRRTVKTLDGEVLEDASYLNR